MGLEEFTDVPARLASAVDQLAKEFEGIFERSYIEALVEQSARQLEGAAVASFVPILARRFARERLRAQALAEGKLVKSVTEIVFVSITGGGRARIAASLLERSVGDTVSVHTAGSGDASGIDPNVRAAMEEVGIDLSDKFTRPLTPEVLASADIVITMGRSVGQVEIPASARHLDWRVGDPAGAELDEVRRVREDIERRITDLLANLQTLATAGTASVGES
jgi:protein-tyrosine-phosphatase